MEEKLSREEIRKSVENPNFLREVFDYDADLGVLRWTKDRNQKARKGDIAGTMCRTSGRRILRLQEQMFTSRRLIWFWHGREIPEGFVLATVNGDVADERIENLCLFARRKPVAKDRSAEKDVELLRSLFDYDPETGILSRKVSRSGTQAGAVIKGSEVEICGVSFVPYRLAFVIHHGRPIGEGMIVDHINGDRSDCRACNLREASRRQNAQNTKARERKSGMPKGVRFHKRDNRFRAEIIVDGVRRHLGNFRTVEEASQAYQDAARLHFGVFACLDR